MSKYYGVPGGRFECRSGLLSVQQARALAAAADGMDYAEIATAIGVGHARVAAAYLSRARDKTGSRNTVAAVAVAFRNGWLRGRA